MDGLVDYAASTFSAIFTSPGRLTVVGSVTVPCDQGHSAENLSIFPAFQNLLGLHCGLVHPVLEADSKPFSCLLAFSDHGLGFVDSNCQRLFTEHIDSMG